MNTVSFLIYLTYVLPSLSTIFGIAAFVLGMATLVAIVTYLVAKGEASSYRASDDDKRFVVTVGGIVKFLVIGLVPSFLLALTIPDRQTMYMIAASELGEEVIDSPEAKQLYQDLRDVIDTYKKKVE